MRTFPSTPSAFPELDRRYQLTRLLGEGASSRVFAAWDNRLERAVAVKLFKARLGEGEARRDRFMREGRLLARLAHPHIAAIHDAGETPDGAAFLVMELASEHTLARELAQRGRLPLEEALALLLPLCGALACAHDQGIVHRDLKPENIVLGGPQGSPRRTAKLLDFGIAKVQGSEGSNAAIGTPAFMAPEQASAGEIGPPTDVWGMGVVLFRCLSGRTPFEAPTPAALLLKLVRERAPRLREVCPELPPRVAVALDRALEPTVQRRYAGMRELARTLAIACDQDGVALPAAPDPVGLAGFEGWRGSGDLNATARLGAAPAENPAGAERRGLFTRRTAAAGLAGLGAIFALALGEAPPVPRALSRALDASSLPRRPTGSRGLPEVARSAALQAGGGYRDLSATAGVCAASPAETPREPAATLPAAGAGIAPSTAALPPRAKAGATLANGRAGAPKPATGTDALRRENSADATSSRIAARSGGQADPSNPAPVNARAALPKPTTRTAALRRATARMTTSRVVARSGGAAEPSSPAVAPTHHHPVRGWRLPGAAEPSSPAVAPTQLEGRAAREGGALGSEGLSPRHAVDLVTQWDW